MEDRLISVEDADSRHMEVYHKDTGKRVDGLVQQCQVWADGREGWIDIVVMEKRGVVKINDAGTFDVERVKGHFGIRDMREKVGYDPESASERERHVERMRST